MAGRFGSVLTAMVTPFDAGGALDLDGAAALGRWLVEHGSDGLVVSGTTGEAPVLSEREKLDLCRAVSEAVTAPVVFGAGTNNTAESIALAREASAAGASAVLVVGPYYNRPPQSGIEAHFHAVAAATELPLVIYDVPARTGRRIAHDVLVSLFRGVSNIIGIKDATGDPPAAARLIADVNGLDLYSGDDAMTLPLLAVGACGVVGVATHWAGLEFQEMIAAFEKGDVAHARDVNARLGESFAYANSDTCVFSQAAKAMMHSLGLAVGECRLPLGPAPDGTEARAREVYANLHA